MFLRIADSDTLFLDLISTTTSRWASPKKTKFAVLLWFSTVSKTLIRFLESTSHFGPLDQTFLAFCRDRKEDRRKGKGGRDDIGEL